MPHIDLEPGVPGIRSAMQFRPETARPLLELAETLLRNENTLSRGERELIAAYVSQLNAASSATPRIVRSRAHSSRRARSSSTRSAPTSRPRR